MRFPRAVLLAIAALAAPVLSFAADAPTPAEAAAAAKVAAAAAAAAAKEGSASRAAASSRQDRLPRPRLPVRRGQHRDREGVERRGPNRDRVRGLQDGFEHSFSFTEKTPSTTYDDRDHWLAFAAEQVKSLKTWRRGREDVRDLLDFLSGAKIATTRKSDSEIRLEVCRDGSPAAEDGSRSRAAAAGASRPARRTTAASRSTSAATWRSRRSSRPSRARRPLADAGVGPRPHGAGRPAVVESRHDPNLAPPRFRRGRLGRRRRRPGPLGLARFPNPVRAGPHLGPARPRGP